MAVWQVDTYRIYMYASRGKFGIIRLEESGGPKHAHLYFRETERDNVISGNFYSLSYLFEAFPAMMEMLREEKPIYVHAYNVNNIYVGTHAEPVGEEET